MILKRKLISLKKNTLVFQNHANRFKIQMGSSKEEHEFEPVGQKVEMWVHAIQEVIRAKAKKEIVCPGSGLLKTKK